MRFSICLFTIALAMTCFAASQANGNKSETAPVFVDFSKCANMGFADDIAGDGKGGWGDQGAGNDFREFDITKREFGGVPFKIIDPAANGGKAVLSFRHESEFPAGLAKAVIDAPSGSSGRYLYILHTACWNGVAQGKTVGTVTVTGRDGKEKIIDVKSRRDVADWWNPIQYENGAVVVSKLNQNATVGVYLSRFDLGAKIDVKSLTLATTGKALWIVVGITITDQDCRMPEMRKMTISAGNEWKALPDENLAVKPGTALDFSAWIDHAPAGSRGRVIARPDGKLAFADQPDRPIRFFVCSGFSGNREDIPADQIEAYADTIMRQGYNMVRLTFLDHYLADQKKYKEKLSLEAQAEFDRRLDAGETGFSPEHVDWMDRYVAALKKRGIFLYVDSMSSWTGIYPADCWNGNNGVKGMDLYTSPAARKHYLNAVKAIFTHVNPYTGTSFVTDPQVAVVLGTNEPNFGRNGVTDTALSAWRDFLRQRFKNIEQYRAAWHPEMNVASFDEAPPYSPKDRFSSRGRFISEFINQLEEKKADWMKANLARIGYHGLFSEYDWLNTLRLYLARTHGEVVSMHGYFAHPDYHGKIKTQQNSAIAESLNWWRGISSTRIAGMPLAVMEYGQVFWNKYRYEEGLTVGAYGSFQDMSALTTHAFPVRLKPNIMHPFDPGADPVHRANQVVTGILFMGNTVKTAPHRVDIPLSRELALNSGGAAVSGDQNRIGLLTGLAVAVEGRESSVPPTLRLPLGDGARTIDAKMWSTVIDSDSGTFSGALTQLRKAGILSADNRTDPAKKIYESETREILLDANNKRLTVNTPLVAGTCGDKWDVPVTIGPLSIESSSVPASITLASRDGQKLGQSGRMLLVIATDARNSGASYDDAEGIVQNNTGKLPVLLRTGSFAIRIARGSGAPALRAWALAMDGSRRDELKVQTSAGGVSLNINTGMLSCGATPFIELAEK